MKQETKTCQNCKNPFTIEPEDFQFYEKIKVPPPTWCPECRMVRRFTWRNVMTLYKRSCDLCKKEVFSIYSPDKPYVVYCPPCWWSDRWNATEQAQEYDFSHPFFGQFSNLLHRTPLLSRFVMEDTMVNSDYTNMANNLNDCYLVFVSRLCERVSYSDNLMGVKDSLDLSYSTKSELCYECFNVHNSYGVRYSVDTTSCRDSYFLKNCVDCSHCFGCVNLRNKQYCIFNQQYTKEEYAVRLHSLGFNPASTLSVEAFRERSRTFWQTAPVKYMHESHNADVSGDYVRNCKKTHTSFFVENVEDSKYCAYLMFGGAVKESYDWHQYGDGGELGYELLQCGNGIYGCRFGWGMWTEDKNLEYGVLNIGSSDCFGCVGIKKKQYCILNKQYSKEEYERLVPKIIEQMSAVPYTDKRGRAYKYGEFFPSELSPFAYNESFAQDEFPLSKAEAESSGYQWNENVRPKHQTTKNTTDLPDNIGDVSETIIQEIISCSSCGRGYRIAPSEFTFYSTQKIPLPKLCFFCRTVKRSANKNQHRLWPRKCQCAGAKSENGVYANTIAHFHENGRCPNEFETSYAPERPEIVYCEQCYNAEVA
ncbi:MAG: hypothetical protein AAB759_00670 [Patescibacteria group bacterium]